jgi:hypothetical protein
MILCHFYQIIAFVPGYTILSPMVNRICMFCFFMDSIFPMYEFLDTCSNPWSAIFLYRYKSVREQVRYHLPVIGLLHHSSKPSTYELV